MDAQVEIPDAFQRDFGSEVAEVEGQKLGRFAEELHAESPRVE